MLIFINTPAMAMSLGLRTLDEHGQVSRSVRRAATAERRRRTAVSDRSATRRRGSWLARSLRLAH